jgi:hypothetical protein
MRVHIVGLPSSGKSTLAKRIATRLGVTHYDLDAIAFVDHAWTPRPASERDRLVSNILAKPGFVAEGFFVEWTQPLFAAADHIVWLDPSLPRLVFRHIRRHGLTRPRWLAARLRFQILSYRRPAGRGPGTDPRLTRSGIESALLPWSDKVLRVRRPTRVEDIIDMVVT